MKVRWMPRALEDLAAIRRYIARDNPVAARRWVSKLEQRANRAALAPLAGRAVPEVSAGDIREVFLRSYRIVYRVREDELHVLTVFEGHRLFPEGVLPDGEDDS